MWGKKNVDRMDRWNIAHHHQCIDGFCLRSKLRFHNGMEEVLR